MVINNPQVYDSSKVNKSVMTSLGTVASFPDPEEHDVSLPMPESLCSSSALALDWLRLSCFVSSLETLQNSRYVTLLKQ